MPKGIPRNQSTQHAVLHRLKIARGHLERVIKMVEKDAYCIDVIHQSQAVQAALRQSDDVLLKNHLETCVAHSLHHGNPHEVIDEVMKVLEKKQHG